MLATWLSYDDLERLVVASLTAPVVGHSVIYGFSDNTHALVGQHLGGAHRLSPRGQLRAVSRRRRGAPAAARPERPDDDLPGRRLRHQGTVRELIGEEPMTRTIVYVACADSHEIAVLRLDPASGALVPVQQVPTGGTVMPLAVSPRPAPALRLDPLGAARGAELRHRPRRRHARAARQQPAAGEHVLDRPRPQRPLAAQRFLWREPGGGEPDRRRRRRRPGAADLRHGAERALDPDRSGEPLRLRRLPRRRRGLGLRLRRRDRQRSSPGRSRPGAPAPAPGRATSPSIRRRRSSTSSTSSTPPSMRSSTTPMPPASATSRRSPRCRPASSASPGRPTSTSAPTGAFSTPASAARAPSRRSRSIPRAAG